MTTPTRPTRTRANSNDLDATLKFIAEFHAEEAQREQVAEETKKAKKPHLTPAERALYEMTLDYLQWQQEKRIRELADSEPIPVEIPPEQPPTTE